MTEKDLKPGMVFDAHVDGEAIRSAWEIVAIYEQGLVKCKTRYWLSKDLPTGQECHFSPGRILDRNPVMPVKD